MATVAFVVSAVDETKINVRLATDADDEAVADLLGDAAPGNPKSDLEVLRWQYRSERFGPTITVVAELDGAVIGHYSAITVPLAVDGRPVRAARGVDIATAPAFQGHGVFRRVAAHLIATARDAGFELIVSTPNDRSLPTLVSLGWTRAGDPQVFVLPVDGRALAERAPVPVPAAMAGLGVRALGLRRRSGPAVDVEVLDDLPEGFDDLLASSVARTGIVRSAEWWRWRYLDHPAAPYRLVAVRDAGSLTCVAAMSVRDDPDGRYVQLLDLMALDRPAARAVLDAAVVMAGQRGAAAVVSAALPGSDQARVLRSAGLIPVPRRIQPRPIHLAVADLTGRRPALATRRWAFSLGDQDHL